MILNQEVIKAMGLGASDVAPNMAHQIFTGRRFAIVLQTKGQQALKALIAFVLVRDHTHDTPQNKKCRAPAGFNRNNIAIHWACHM